MMFPKPLKIFLYICLTVVVFLLLIFLSAAATVALINLAQYLGGPIGTFLIDKGPARIMRRALLVGVIIIFIFSLKKFGWRGWQDCGWNQWDDKISSRRAQFGWGAALGFISLGSIALLTIFTGLHQLKPLKENYPAIIGTVLFFCLSGLSVALIEETICRGILFRVFARAWNAWTAALVASIPFALAHSFGPDNAAFHGNSFLRVSTNASISTLTNIIPAPDSILLVVNLTLLGIVLCAFVMRTKTIWMSAGAHATWVFIIKLHSYFTDLNTAAVSSIWLGKRNDFMDSLAATLLFAILLFLTLFWKKRAGQPVKIGGAVWHIRPGESALDNFLKKGEDLFAGGNVLKAYHGCRITAKDGLVLKKYFPKNFLNGLRFAFRLPRSRRAFLLADALIRHGLPTPPVLAWSATRRLGLLTAEAMIVSEATNAEPLTLWLERKTADAEKRLKVMEAYGSLMAAFHRNRYSNRDLKHENVMCSKTDPALLQVVDLDGVRKKMFITRRRAGKDLMRIGKSLASPGWTGKAEIAAFFEVYNRLVSPRMRFHSFPE